MKYANYDKTTGELIGYYDTELHEAIPEPSLQITDEQWQEALDKGYNYIDIDNKTLSKKDFRTFAELQTAKISELTSVYNKANEADITYMKTTFQANYKSQGLIVSVLSAGSVLNGFYWLDVNNKEVAMTYADLQGLSGDILARSQANFTKLQTLKANVKACTTQAELDKIVW